VQVSTSHKAVGTWLFIGVAMILIQVILGGVTRLTGSGLSITEWQPILGALPPLNNQEWLLAFEKYQTHTSQYQFVNSHFTLADFKQIYFWEWMHREWARLLGIVFIVGFCYFLFKKKFTKDQLFPFMILFLLGFLQGAIGWIMVKSGIDADNLYVSHIRLAIHFVMATILGLYTLWFAVTTYFKDAYITSGQTLIRATIVLILLVLIQLVFGAFIAGLKCANVAATWPSINGAYLPKSIFNFDLVYDKINIQFVHRTLAYLIFLLTIRWFLKARKLLSIQKNAILKNIYYLPLVFVCIQVALGITTLLSATTIKAGVFGLYEYLATAHQTVALLFISSLVMLLAFFKKTSVQ
jgi:cytochrome c oxidase assembly protein subunit 15